MPSTDVALLDAPASRAWYCVRSIPKHEHIAAAHLRDLGNVEVFLPRIRFRRPTARGPVWTTEALFPNYLFARFELATSLRPVIYTNGVAGVVHFGLHWPAIPGDVIDNLRNSLGEEELREIPSTVSPGDEIRIVGGAFNGLEGVITRVMPSRQRVAVLLDFLGRQTTVELNTAGISCDTDKRRIILG